MLAVILKNGFLAKLLNLWIFFLWEILGQNNDSSDNVTEIQCWNDCLCYNLTIRCLLVGLTQVPTNLSHTTKTLWVVIQHYIILLFTRYIKKTTLKIQCHAMLFSVHTTNVTFLLPFLNTVIGSVTLTKDRQNENGFFFLFAKNLYFDDFFCIALFSRNFEWVWPLKMPLSKSFSKLCIIP